MHRPSIFVEHGSVFKVEQRASTYAIRSDYTSVCMRIEGRMKQVRDEFHENSSHQCRVCTHASNRVIYEHEDWFSLLAFARVRATLDSSCRGACT